MILARYRYLRKTFLDRFLPHRHSKGLGQTLAKMVDVGLIHKPREQRQGYNSLWCPDVYEITDKGMERLPEGVLMATRIWKDAGAKVQFAHALTICDTIASIELGLGDRFVTWQEIVAKTSHPKPLTLPYTISYKTVNDGKAYKSSLVPDGLFGIRHADHIAYFFLEVEREGKQSRSDFHQSSFFKKLLGYDNIDDTGVAKERLGISSFQLLAVFKSTRIVENRLRLIEEVLGETNLVGIHSVPMQDGDTKAPPPFPQLAESWWQTTDGTPFRLA